MVLIGIIYVILFLIFFLFNTGILTSRISPPFTSRKNNSLFLRILIDCKKSIIGEGVAVKGPEAKGRALLNVLYFEFQKLVTLKVPQNIFLELSKDQSSFLNWFQGDLKPCNFIRQP